MRLITPIVGTVAIQVHSDDVMPFRGVPQRHVSAFVADRYNFNVQPELAAIINAGQLPVMQFQSGLFNNNGDLTPINQMSMFGDGDSVSAHDTDLATPILEDLVWALNDNLNYRFEASHLNFLYNSAVVVEFEPEFISVMLNDSLQRAARACLPQSLGEIGIQRLAISPSAAATATFPSVRAIVPNDFVIERRAGAPIDAQRWFCTAPVSTSTHLNILEEMERKAIGG